MPDPPHLHAPDPYIRLDVGVFIAAAADRVFCALTTDQEIEIWAAESKGQLTCHLRCMPGGLLHLRGQVHPGVELNAYARVTQVERPRSLVFRIREKTAFAGLQIISITLLEHERSTHLRIEHSGFVSAERNQQARDIWYRSMQRLQNFLATES